MAGVDLQAYAGQATALLGRNGAGKSTTMRVLGRASCRRPRARVRVAGLDVRTQTLEVKRVIGYCPDVGGLVPRATPWEHLQLSARLRRLTGWEDARPRPARAVRARRRRPPGDRRLLPRHGPPALGGARGAAPAAGRSSSTSRSTASTRSASRPPSTSSPTPARAAPASWSPPTCASWPIEACSTVARAARRCPRRRPSTRPRWPARRGLVPTAHSWTRRGSAAPVRDVGHLHRASGSGDRPTAARVLPWALRVLVRLTAAAALVPAFIAGAGDSDGRSRVDAADPADRAWPASSLLAIVSGRRVRRRPRAARRATRRSPSRSARPPTTSARCSWRRSTSPGCSRPGPCWAPVRTRSAPASCRTPCRILLWVAAATALGQVAGLDRRGRTPRTARHLDHPGAWPCAFGRGRGSLLQLTGTLAPLLDRMPDPAGRHRAGSTASARAGPRPCSSAGRCSSPRSCSAPSPAHLAAGGRRATSCGSSPGCTSPAGRRARPWLGVLRIDRASVWRSVPMRRGMIVLAIGPGLVALAGDLTWRR